MLRVTSTMTRPSSESAWFFEADIEVAKVLNNLKTASEIQNSSTSISNDSLTYIGIFEFNSYGDYYSWTEKIREADAMFLLKRNDYIVSNGHTLKIEESVDNDTLLVEKQL